MYGVATQNGVGLGVGNIPTLTSLAYPQMLNAIVLGAFSGGAPGWLYDDSRMDTLFQDAAGTTPVTALEQPVGLQLDLSQGLVLGAELITPAANRDFSSDTGYWTKGTGVTIGSGVCAFSGVANRSGVTKTLLLTTGAYYEITFTVVSCSGGGFSAYAGGTDGNLVSAPGTYTQRLAAAGTSFAISARGVTTGSIDDVSIKLVLGNHRYQPTSANRPTWSARYNEMVKTEVLSDAAWSPTGATASVAAVALPTGCAAASLVTATAGGLGYHYRYQDGSQTFPAGTQLKLTGKFKQGSTQWAALADGGDAVWHTATFDLVAGTVSGQNNAVGAISADVNGWWNVSMTYTLTNSYAGRVIAAPSVSAGNSTAPNYVAAGTETVYVTGMDLRPSDQATGLIPTYQRVDTATSYDANGFPAGLQWNGSNSWMQNASVDFSGTNKVSLVVGVRKLSDAGAGILFETSTAPNSTNGSISIQAPTGADTNYGYYSRGTSQQGVTPTPYISPITNVLSAQSDISAPSISMQVNGVAAGSTSASQGTGNFGNYPAYFGARAGSSLFFNGLTFSNIAIGIALSASQIAAFEAWTNSRTKAYA